MTFDVFDRLPRLLRHLDARIAVHPDYADLRNLRGLVHGLQQDHAAACADFEVALQSNPLYHAARANWAWALAQGGDSRASEAAAQVSPEAFPEWRSHFEFLRRMQADGPVAARRQLVATPGDAGPWRQLDMLWMHIGAGDVGAATSQLASWSDPDLQECLRESGLRAGGATPEPLLRAWARSYGGNPLASAVWWAAAEVERFDGSWAQGLRLLHWGAALSSDVYSYNVEMAHHLEAKGCDHDAIARLRRAARLDPARVQAHVGLGYALAARGQAEEALQAFERAAALEPRFADVRYQLGLLCLDLERHAEAEGHLRAALDAQPDYVLARLALATHLHALGRDTEALPLLQSVRRTGLRSMDLEQWLGEAYERLGRSNQARRAFARVRAAKRRTAFASEDDVTETP